MLSTNFDMIDYQKSINTCDLQYLNPTAYRELLACIVEADKAAFCDTLLGLIFARTNFRALRVREKF